MEGVTLILLGLLIVVVFGLGGWLASRFVKCPSDKILVVYGMGAKDREQNAKCIKGGAFVLPLIQEYQFLDLTPITITADLQNALSKQNIRVNAPSKFTVAISDDTTLMNNAATRLLGLPQNAIQDLAKDIIFGQMRLAIAQLDIEEINSERDKLIDKVAKNLEAELGKIGLKLINVNISDVSDESGYLESLGKKAAAEALNEAKISVAEEARKGAIGEANARKAQRIEVSQAEAEATVGEANAKKEERILIAQAEAEALAGEANSKKEQRIKVAQAEAEAISGEANSKKEQRIKVAQADSLAIMGENDADAKIAESNATLREKRAEAARRATTAEKIKAAQVLQEAYSAEKAAEDARAEKEEATLQADILVKAEIAKREREIQAQAEAEQIKIKAKGEADAIYARMEAEARGVQEMLSRQAAGIAQYVQAAGGTSEDALRMMIADKIETLLSTQVEAIKNIRIDKVTVWDGGSENGANSTANFLSGMMKAVPPMQDIFNMAGLDLPSYIAKKAVPENKPATPAKQILPQGQTVKAVAQPVPQQQRVVQRPAMEQTRQ